MKIVRRLGLIALTLLWVQSGWSEDQAVASGEIADVAPVTAAEAAPVAAEAVDTEAMLKEDHPESYLVVKGDTLWGIANRFLKNPWMWPEIWHVNPQIANPHLIYPGDTVKLIYLEGGPKLTVKRGEAGMTYKLSPEAPATSSVGGSAETSDSINRVGGEGESRNVVGGNGDQKLQPSVRVMPLEEPIPAIPLDIIDPFLSNSRIVQPGVLEAAPYVVAGDQRHVISGAGSELHAKGKFDPKHKVYGFFRKGKVYVDPVTKEVLGVQALNMGVGKIKSAEGELARFSVANSSGEVRLGDRLLVNQERRVEPTFFPSAPEVAVEGEIIDVEGGVSQVGAMSVVVINKGERDELQSGNVLAIYQRGETVRDPLNLDEQIRLPGARAGLVMVFSPFEKLSYALVLYADRPLRVGDYVRKP